MVLAAHAANPNLSTGKLQALMALLFPAELISQYRRVRAPVPVPRKPLQLPLHIDAKRRQLVRKRIRVALQEVVVRQRAAARDNDPVARAQIEKIAEHGG